MMKFWLIVLAFIAGALVFWVFAGIGLATGGWH